MFFFISGEQFLISGEQSPGCLALVVGLDGWKCLLVFQARVSKHWGGWRPAANLQIIHFFVLLTVLSMCRTNLRAQGPLLKGGAQCFFWAQRYDPLWKVIQGFFTQWREQRRTHLHRIKTLIRFKTSVKVWPRHTWWGWGSVTSSDVGRLLGYLFLVLLSGSNLTQHIRKPENLAGDKKNLWRNNLRTQNRFSRWCKFVRQKFLVTKT